MPQAQRTITIDVTPDQLLQVILDYEKYPEFLPEVKSTQIVSRSADGKVFEVAYEIEVVKKLRYTLKQEVLEDGVRWSLVKGDLFKKNQGSWKIEPEGEGRTRATYSLEVAFGGWIPIPDSVVNKLTETSLPKLLENYKNRAESLFKKVA